MFGHIREKSDVQVEGVVAAGIRAATWALNFSSSYVGSRVEELARRLFYLGRGGVCLGGR